MITTTLRPILIDQACLAPEELTRNLKIDSNRILCDLKIYVLASETLSIFLTQKVPKSRIDFEFYEEIPATFPASQAKILKILY